MLKKKRKRKISAIIKNQFVTGLIVLLPLGLSLYILLILFNLIAGSFIPLLREIRAFQVIHPMLLRLISFVITLFIIWIIGVAARNIVGRRILGLTEKILLKAPILNRIYHAIREIVRTVMFNKMAFRRVVIIEYPRKGLYTLAFVTNHIEDKENKKRYLTLFIPTTPNPTSGWFILLPEEETKPSDITVEEGMKMIISGGIVLPHKFKLNKERR